MNTLSQIMLPRPHSGTAAFSLVEVVLALGLCTFVIIGFIGLLSVGIHSGKDSEDQIRAANMASLLISTRAAAPTNHIANFAVPASAMTNSFANAFSTSPIYVGEDGYTTNAANASYRVTCMAGTNFATGTRVAQVYLMLSWPPQTGVTNGVSKHYELLTYIPLQ